MNTTLSYLEEDPFTNLEKKASSTRILPENVYCNVLQKGRRQKLVCCVESKAAMPDLCSQPLSLSS